MFGAKLSWCQIVRCQIVLVPNCPFFNSWCQIVRCQIVLQSHGAIAHRFRGIHGDDVISGQQLHGIPPHFRVLPPGLHHPPHIHLGMRQGY